VYYILTLKVDQSGFFLLTISATNINSLAGIVGEMVKPNVNKCDKNVTKFAMMEFDSYNS
jgi:hypothetical protein